MKRKVSIFLDSGAYSAWTQNLMINIDDYIEFIQEHKDILDIYANLDVIGDGEASYTNWKYMRSKGLNPLPVYHLGIDEKYLVKYLNEVDFIALGGMTPLTTDQLISRLDGIWCRYFVDSEGCSIVRVHGFGITSLRLMIRYPWYSVDSTSWVLTSRFGSVYVPRKRQGKYMYDENSWKVTVSNKSPSRSEEGKHITTFTQMERNQILEYFDLKGYRLGKSEVRTEKRGYKLQEGERWFGKEEMDFGKDVYSSDVQDDRRVMRKVETVIESGLCNDYKQRDEMNIIYFLDLEKSIPEWPWPFKLKLGRSFGL